MPSNKRPTRESQKAHDEQAIAKRLALLKEKGLAPDEIRKWAGSQGIDGGDFKALCEHPTVVELVGSVVREKNKELAAYEQIKYVRILPEEFSQESGTLTATMKVRRREVIKRYGDLLEGLYK